MRRTADRLLFRVLALVMTVGLLWLAWQAGNAGLADIYAASAAASRQHMARVDARSESWHQALARGERSITHAREMLPRNPSYALRAADFAFHRQRPETAAEYLRTGLADAPVRAELWSRLAAIQYQMQGPSAATLHALDQALYFGPREYYSLVVNATITLNSEAGLEEARRRRGWSAVVAAARMPGLDEQISRLARESGMERQLRALLRETNPGATAGVAGEIDPHD